MSRVFSRLTSKSRTTVPKYVRHVLGVEPGDVLEYVIDGEGVILRGLPGAGEAHLRVLQKMLCEWDTPEDAAVFDDL